MLGGRVPRRHRPRPAAPTGAARVRGPPRTAASLRKGTRSLWTKIPACPRHKARRRSQQMKRRGDDPAHRRRDPPPSTCTPASPARCSTTCAGQAGGAATRPAPGGQLPAQDQMSQGAAVVIGASDLALPAYGAATGVGGCRHDRAHTVSGCVVVICGVPRRVRERRRACACGVIPHGPQLPGTGVRGGSRGEKGQAELRFNVLRTGAACPMAATLAVLRYHT